MLDKLGVCQWFHYEDFDSVDRAVELLHELGVRHLRTGISWADYHRPRGKAWYDWQMERLADFEVLLSVWHTPPSIAAHGCCSSPPARLADFADFVGQVCDEYGEFFAHFELWNEPNNRYKWDFRRFDPGWQQFGEMIRLAAPVAVEHGKTAVLGGMIPVDPHWLELMRSYGAVDDLDAIAIHAFPEMWWPHRPNWEWFEHWQGWRQKVESIEPHIDGRPVWVTETGLATWNLDREDEARFDLQVRMLERAVRAPVEKLYWYSLIDLDPAREAIEGFHVDENEYHMGLVAWDGRRKPAFDRFRELLRLPEGAEAEAGREVVPSSASG